MALRSEWIKLASLRSTPVVTGLTALLGGLTSLAVATFVTDEVLYASDVFVYSTVLTAVLELTSVQTARDTHAGARTAGRS